jgi:hypothetical protein
MGEAGALVLRRSNLSRTTWSVTLASALLSSRSRTTASFPVPAAKDKLVEPPCRCRTGRGEEHGAVILQVQCRIVHWPESCVAKGSRGYGVEVPVACSSSPLDSEQSGAARTIQEDSRMATGQLRSRPLPFSMFAAAYLLYVTSLVRTAHGNRS